MLAYYATFDGLPGAGKGCEQTSTQALASELSKLYGYLDNDKIVGGRIDLVVHSMGGLVARNFSSTQLSHYAYTNLRNRYLGVFRDVVTLDTPETGSALAYYLDYVYSGRTKNDNANSTSAYLWNVICSNSRVFHFGEDASRLYGSEAAQDALNVPRA